LIALAANVATGASPANVAAGASPAENDENRTLPNTQPKAAVLHAALLLRKVDLKESQYAP